MYKNVSLISKILTKRFQRNITTLSVLQNAVEELPKKNFANFLDPPKLINYMSNYTNSTYICKGLINFGIKPDSKMLMWTESTYEALQMFWACAMMGLHLITIDPRISEDTHIRQILKESQAKILLYSPDSGTVARIPILTRLLPELQSVQNAMFVTPMDHLEYGLQYVFSTTTESPQDIATLPFHNLYANYEIRQYLEYIMPQITDNHKLLSGYKLSKSGDIVYDEGYTQSQCIDIAKSYADILNITTDESMAIGLPLCTVEGIIASLIPTFVNATMVVPSRYNHANFFISGAESQQSKYFIMSKQLHTELTSESSKEIISNTTHLKGNFKPENILVI